MGLSIDYLYVCSLVVVDVELVEFGNGLLCELFVPEELKEMKNV